MPDFSSRAAGQEIMDDLNCKGEVVDQTLRELHVINRWLGGNRLTLKGIQILLKNKERGAPVRIADLGCGGGEMLKLISSWGRKSNIRTELTGIDANPNIVDFAVRHSANYPGIRFETTNVFSEDFSEKKFDIILATLFTHHFSDNELITMLSNLQRQSRYGVVINDLHRHWLAYYSIRLLTRLFSRSAMVRFDAPLSVLRAFTRPELESILTSAGIEGYILRWKWAFRWQLIIPGKPANTRRGI